MMLSGAAQAGEPAVDVALVKMTDNDKINIPLCLRVQADDPRKIEGISFKDTTEKPAKDYFYSIEQLKKLTVVYRYVKYDAASLQLFDSMNKLSQEDKEKLEELEINPQFKKGEYLLKIDFLRNAIALVKRNKRDQIFVKLKYDENFRQYQVVELERHRVVTRAEVTPHKVAGFMVGIDNLKML